MEENNEPIKNAPGTVKTCYSYTPFGVTTATGEASGNAIQYTGRENDGATGLYFYRARYCSPLAGRFISEDPIGYAAGDANFYAYVGNDPFGWTDPLGLDWLESAAYISAGFGDTLTSGFGLTYLFGLPSGTEAIRGLWNETFD